MFKGWLSPTRKSAHSSSPISFEGDVSFRPDHKLSVKSSSSNEESDELDRNTSLSSAEGVRPFAFTNSESSGPQLFAGHRQVSLTSVEEKLLIGLYDGISITKHGKCHNCQLCYCGLHAALQVDGDSPRKRSSFATVK